MNRREKILLGAVCAILGYLALEWFVVNSVQGPVTAREERIDGLVQQIDAKTKELRAARVAQVELGRWRARALPPDVDFAQTLYQGFVRELVDSVGITAPTITPSAMNRKNKASHLVLLPFTVKAQCGLDQLTRLLHRFYDSGLLHQVRGLSLTPVVADDAQRKFDLTLTIEAASMLDAVAKDGLPKVKPNAPDAPKLAPLDQYVVFANKNIFQPTKLVDKAPPPPVAVAVRAVVEDDREDYTVTGAVVVDGVATLWLGNEKTSEPLFIPEGEDLEIPGMRARVIKVSPREVLLEVGGRRGPLALGQTLAAWKSTDDASTD